MRFHLSAPAALTMATLLAACARHAAPPPSASAAPPPVVAMVPAPLPAGARPGMTVPLRLADGSYPTPNRALSAAGAIWHLRSALNVAALACRGAQEASIIARYNALLAARKAELASAQATLQSEYRAGGGDWQDRFDDQMTRLYNFFAQDLARDAFCAGAADTLDTIATVPAATLPAFAAERLAALERPFTDFFAAYDRWRAGQLVPATVAAADATPAPGPAAGTAG
ncbi:hypothetical protein [Sphingomonas sp. BK235]|uniref:hypothetical protein n=1 Tax=Sphingomonas sp. BK235 TaxID=2512131 RepID=UPI001046F458|nr:hypothetical protein [Sphingomonas sp. BK235]TCP35890.1 hypothetical protein EV292_102479 [Sphingomonas sp. BK235]